jgi:hypothetical protein
MILGLYDLGFVIDVNGEKKPRRAKVVLTNDAEAEAEAEVPENMLRPLPLGFIVDV